MLVRVVAGVALVVACSKGEPPKKAPVAKPDAACALAIVVDPGGVSIGTQAGACRAPRVDGKPDVAWVESELKTLKWEMETCSNAVIVAETGPYREPIALMDLAVKTGFIDIGFGDKSDALLVTDAHDSHCKPPPPAPPPPKRLLAQPGIEQPIWPPLTPEEVKKLEEPIVLPPPSDPKETLQRAPVIIVTKTEVTYQGRFMAAVDVVGKEPQALKPLSDALRAADDKIKHDFATGAVPSELVRACVDAEQGIRESPGMLCPRGLVILQADETTDMRVVNALIATGTSVGFDNWLFAVKQR
jgi:hypothetical protein